MEAGDRYPRLRRHQKRDDERRRGVVFDPTMAAQVEARLERSGQLHSKMRFMAAQLLALLKDDLWLRNARHAYTMAARLRERLAAARGVDIVLPIEGNHVFVRLEASPLRKLQEAGTAPWQSGSDKSGRPVYPNRNLVCDRGKRDRTVRRCLHQLAYSPLLAPKRSSCVFTPLPRESRSCRGSYRRRSCSLTCSVKVIAICGIPLSETAARPWRRC